MTPEYHLADKPFIREECPCAKVNTGVCRLVKTFTRHISGRPDYSGYLHES